MPPSSTVDRSASPARASKKLDVSLEPASKGKQFTWQQVAEHNTPESPWVIVDGKVYDLTEFQHKHPGGKTMILLAAGRECTDLFNMYHVLNEEKARKYLKAYEVGTLVGPNEFPAFAPDKAGLYDTLKKRVRDHFKKTGENPITCKTGLKSIIPVLITFFAAFIAINHPAIYPLIPTWARYLLCVVLGVGQALPLLHWMHDASHGSIGKGALNDFFGQFSLDLYAGASISAWHHQHILGHHVYTNVYQCDPDLPGADTGDMRRIVPVQKWTWIYRFQHLYLPVLYFLLAMKVRISDITDYFFLKKNGPIRVNWHPGIVARQIITKSLWVGWRMLLPIFILGAPAGHVMWYWFVSDLVTGGFLAYNFQVSHVVEDCEWPNGVPPTSAKKNSKKAAAVADKNVEMSWAENQIRTSVDYGHDSAVWTYLCGHLNYQIEHHLFPGVSQYHYPALAPIVKQTCKEFGLPYIYKPTFYEALMAHFGYLYNMGKAGKAVHMD